MKGFNGGGMPQQMQELLKKAQKMQKSIEEATQESEAQIFEGSAGGGGVTAKVNGRFEVQAVSINPDLLQVSEKELLEQMILVAVNDAVKKARETLQSKLSKVTGGVPIPGLV